MYRWLLATGSLRGEALYRSGQGRPFIATTFGYEYTFVGIGNGRMNLGVLGKYVFDDRSSHLAKHWVKIILTF